MYNFYSKLIDCYRVFKVYHSKEGSRSNELKKVSPKRDQIKLLKGVALSLKLRVFSNV